MKMQWVGWLGLIGVASGLTVQAGEGFTVKSGPQQTALLELFTSEGCSSCPPAERWLAGLTNSPILWKDIVPVEFHVDYWDNLGWSDRFASSQHTERQQQYAELWRHSSVYTPGFVLNGKEWRNSFGLSNFPKGDRAVTGVLEVRQTGAREISVTYVPDAINHRTGGLEVTAAWLARDVASDIRKGENAGTKPHHTFVVLKTQTVPLPAKGNAATANLALSRLPHMETQSLGLAVWVSRSGNPSPEQAVGGWWTGE